METFKEFRGREPKVDAYLEEMGIIETTGQPNPALKPGGSLKSNPSVAGELSSGAKTAGKAVGKVLHKCIIPLTVLAFAVDYY